MEDLDSLLLQSAKLNAKIRKRMHEEKKPANSKLFTYVLLLNNGNFYVGSSNNLFTRFNQHIYDLDYSSKWVRHHGPVVRVVEVIRNSSLDDEVYKTLEFMEMFGYQSVRGAHWTTVELRGPPVALASFVRNRSDFEYMPRTEINKTLEVAKELHDIMVASD